MRDSRKSGRRTRVVRTLTLFAILTTALSGQAGARESSWTVRVVGLGWIPSDAMVAGRTAAAEPFRFGVSEGAGLGLALEYRLGRRWGLEGAANFADMETDFRLETGGVVLTDTDEVDVSSYSLGVNYHFTPESRADFFVGAFVAETFVDDSIFLTEAGRLDKVVFDDDVGYGLQLGVELPLSPGGHWSLTAGVRYILTILEGEIAGLDDDLDPLIPWIGVGYRF